MTPVMQNRFAAPHGNCHAACLASIFECSLEDVPEFGNGPDWQEKFSEWCFERRGLKPLDISIESLENWTPPGFHLINGPTASDSWHSVVGFRGQIVHDPMPGGLPITPFSFTLFISDL